MKSRLKGSDNIFTRLIILCSAIFLVLLIAVTASGCGDEAGSTTTTPTLKTTTTSDSPSVNTVTDSGPVMPNVDETQVAAVEAAASAAFSREWGDGTGVHIVWGPNIISDWALIGMENESGLAGKDVLLRQEGGVWQVKDTGHALALKWESQTPAGLWPTV
ncbi:MAG: hypothetical protein WC828_03650 [Thermoleophilia bacterium]